MNLNEKELSFLTMMVELFDDHTEYEDWIPTISEEQVEYLNDGFEGIKAKLSDRGLTVEKVLREKLSFNDDQIEKYYSETDIK